MATAIKDMAINAIKFPNLSPELFSFNLGGFEFAIRWYALAYIIGVVLALQIIKFALSKKNLWTDCAPPMTVDQADELVTNLVLGIILGGRLGFVLFYQLDYYLLHPIEALMIWQGGMSFHGGFIGVAIAGIWFCKKNALSLSSVGDIISVASPPGLFLGRLSNFVNNELWGRPTEWAWGVIFPGKMAQNCPGFSTPCARHASQIYEAGLEGFLLGALMIWLAYSCNWLRKPGRLIGMFLIGYGVCRFSVEFFRQPDPYFITQDNPIGYALSIASTNLTMGQMLTLPMICLGSLFLFKAFRA